MATSLTELFSTPGGRGWVEDALKEIVQHCERFWTNQFILKRVQSRELFIVVNFFIHLPKRLIKNKKTKMTKENGRPGRL